MAEDGSAEEIPEYDDICSQAFNPCPTPTIAVGRRRIFSRGSESGLWTTDGTAAGPVTVPEGGILEPAALGPAGRGRPGPHPSGGLWSSDGSPEGGPAVHRSTAVQPQSPGAFPAGLPTRRARRFDLPVPESSGNRRAGHPGAGGLAHGRDGGRNAAPGFDPLPRQLLVVLEPRRGGRALSSSGSAARSGRATGRPRAPTPSGAVAGRHLRPGRRQPHALRRRRIPGRPTRSTRRCGRSIPRR